MRLDYTEDDGRGRAALSLAADGVVAGPVIDRLLLDAHPAVLSFDRVAVAGVLAFGPWLSGSLELPGAVSPEVAEAIDRYTAHAPVRGWPVALNEDSHFSSGRRLVVLADRTEPATDPGPREDSEAVLHIRRSDQYAGSLVSLQHIIVSTNAYAVAAVGEDTVPFTTLAVAVATLFAEDLAASAVVLTGLPALGEEEMSRAADLLASVDLTLGTG